MVDDLINLTQGQLLIKYWWLWLAIVLLSAVVLYFLNKKNGNCHYYETKECKHEKIYANYVLTSISPQVPWTCQKCGKKGTDRQINR